MSADPPLAAKAQTPQDFACPRFDAGSQALVDWLKSLRTASAGRAALALILALESLRRADISPSRRCSLLRLFKGPLLKVCTGLPKPRDWAMRAALGTAGGAAARGVGMEQRLYRLMFQSLAQALHQLDRCYFMLDGRQVRRRQWALRNLFRFFDRQIRYAALWGGPLPEGAWRDLHDLYAYLSVRRQPRQAGPVADLAGRTVDPDLEYKRILLFGLAAELAPSGVRHGTLLDGLRHWALQTQLEDPQGLSGQTGLLVVELSQDTPPRRHPGHLAPDFRGWVLVPPEGLVEHLDRSVYGEGSLFTPQRGGCQSALMG